MIIYLNIDHFSLVYMRFPRKGLNALDTGKFGGADAKGTCLSWARAALTAVSGRDVTPEDVCLAMCFCLLSSCCVALARWMPWHDG